MTHDEVAELLGAYALDAVDADEAAEVEAHLLDCPRCRDEVAHHREVAAALAYAGASAPDGLWGRIAATLETSPAEGELGRLYPFKAPRRSFAARVVLGAGSAAAAAVIALLGVQVRTLNHRVAVVTRALPGAGLQAAAQAALLDPKASRLHLQSDDHQVFVDAVVAKDGSGYLVANNLPFLTPARTYQLWAVVGDRKISLGVLGSHPTVAAFQATASVAALAVTDEVGGGVTTSVQKPVVVGFLDPAARPVTS